MAQKETIAQLALNMYLLKRFEHIFTLRVHSYFVQAIATSLELYADTESFKSGGRVNKGLNVLAKAYRQLAEEFSERFSEQFPNTGY